MLTNRILILFLFLLPFLSLAQDTGKTKFFNNIEISGGLLFDLDSYNYIYQESEIDIYSNKNYVGFGYIMIGLGGEKDNTMYGVELEILGFRVMPDLEILDEYTLSDGTVVQEYAPEFLRNKNSLQLNLYYGRKFIDSEKYQFAVAPLISLRILEEYKHSIGNAGYDIWQDSYALGLGVKLKNQFWLSDNFGITISTRFLLADLEWTVDGIFDHALAGTAPIPPKADPVFGFDFIRDEFLLQIGLQLKI